MKNISNCPICNSTLTDSENCLSCNRYPHHHCAFFKPFIKITKNIDCYSVTMPVDLINPVNLKLPATHIEIFSTVSSNRTQISYAFQELFFPNFVADKLILEVNFFSPPNNVIQFAKRLLKLSPLI